MSNRHTATSFEALLEYLRLNRAFDFTGYKRPSILRRVRKRMEGVRIKDFDDYQDYLSVHPDEFISLFNTILINVTGFFRDPQAWDYLSSEIVPRILHSKKPDEPIRVWSAGCADGSEAYTIAMVLCEAMGIDDFRRRVKIYATDIDGEALDAARRAAYTPKQLEPIPEKLKEKYFRKAGNGYSFNGDMRRAIIFGRNDLVQDSPMSRLDLLVCRNTLMYFNAETQSRILARFHFALADDGFLFLGRSELLLTHADLFKPVNSKFHIFAKVTRGYPRERFHDFAQANALNSEARLLHDNLVAAGFDASEIPKIVVDVNGILVTANEKARQYFSVSPSDFGRPFRDIELSYRPVELRSAIEKTYVEGRKIKLPTVERMLPGGEAQILEILLTPLFDSSASAAGVNISFTDVTESNKLGKELEKSKQELGTTAEELQSANEELETTNEELQSTVEELETTNEELQSSNEELETMNEELQSTNEELQTMNDEARMRTEELHTSNIFFNSILTSILHGVIVLDRDGRVQLWNDKVADWWGLRGNEVQGQNFFSLDIGLPVGELRRPVRECLDGDDNHIDVRLDTLNRRGKSFLCDVKATPLLDEDKKIKGCILFVEEVRRENDGKEQTKA